MMCVLIICENCTEFCTAIIVNNTNIAKKYAKKIILYILCVYFELNLYHLVN